MTVPFQTDRLLTLGRLLAFMGISAILVGQTVHSHHQAETSDGGDVVDQTAHSCRCHQSPQRDGKPEDDSSEQPSEPHDCHVCQLLAQVPQRPAVASIPLRLDAVFEMALPSSDDPVEGVTLAVRQRGPPAAV